VVCYGPLDLDLAAGEKREGRRFTSARFPATDGEVAARYSMVAMLP
jgi:hypothetical protein